MPLTVTFIYSITVVFWTNKTESEFVQMIVQVYEFLPERNKEGKLVLNLTELR